MRHGKGVPSEGRRGGRGLRKRRGRATSGENGVRDRVPEEGIPLAGRSDRNRGNVGGAGGRGKNGIL